MDYDKYDNQENQEVRRKRRRSRRHKNSGCAGTMVYVIAVVGASLVISLAAIFTANDVFAFVKDNAMQQFYVSENTKLANLAKDLDSRGLSITVRYSRRISPLRATLPTMCSPVSTSLTPAWTTVRSSTS